MAIEEKLSKHKIVLKEEGHIYIVNDKKGYHSVSRVLDSLLYPFEAEKKAFKCSQNPKHQYYGWKVEAIIKVWEENNRLACERGSSLHQYIQAVFEGDEKLQLDLLNTDAYLHPEDVKAFHLFIREFFNAHNFEIVRLENAVALPTYMVCGTFDALVSYLSSLIIFDWKSNGKFDTQSDYYMKPPFHRFDNSKLTYYTFQTYLYKYILETEYEIEIKGTRIAYIRDGQYQVHKPKFAYDKAIIIALLDNYRKLNPIKL